MFENYTYVKIMRVYLNQAEADSQQEDSDTEGGPLGVGQTAKELSEIDQRVCDMCGITFFEFRNQGRLGCPHDYVQFENELEPLIANIHGEVQHHGCRPHREKSVGEKRFCQNRQKNLHV